FTDVLGTGRDLSSRVRVRQALVTGAGTLVASCPQCCRMPDDAVKTVGLQGRIRTAGIAEIAAESITGA
ncbi:MAG: (Fe-S)-binding protein, partial [Desulfomonilia bacterium]